MPRLIAIGDIHGRMKMLDLLIKKINPQNTDKIIFIGDYIDRGPKSKEVIDFLIDFSRNYNCIFLRGNHEDMLLDFIDVDEKALHGESFLLNGGAFTANSYGCKLTDLAYLRNYIPHNHLSFLSNLLYYHIEDDYIFVHAGIIPGIPLEEQKRENLLWIREQFISYPTGLDKIIVFGHTPQKKVLVDNDKIGIDTGAGYKMSLSAIELRTKEIYTVKYSEINQK